jgi:hypothetical protein
MQLAASRDKLNCVQLGALAPSFSAEGASYKNELRKFLCPCCYIRCPGEVYPVGLCCRYHPSLIDVPLNSTWSEWQCFTCQTRHDLQKLCCSVSISLNSAQWPPISPCKWPRHGTNMSMGPVLKQAVFADAVLLCCSHLFGSAEQTMILQWYLSA